MAMLPWNLDELTFDVSRFNGRARLFPLPDLVLFPYVMQPLRIFEPRYRALLNEALDGDGLIAMCQPARRGERDEFGRRRLLPHACLGKVVSHHRLDDGCYNIMLLGLRRGRIVRESAPDGPFRRAELELIEESCDGDGDLALLQTTLATRFGSALPAPAGARVEPQVLKMLESEIPLGVLTDLISFALPLPRATKLKLLGEANAARRAQALLSKLPDAVADEVAGPPLRDFPPRTSLN